MIAIGNTGAGEDTIVGRFIKQEVFEIKLLRQGVVRARYSLGRFAK